MCRVERLLGIIDSFNDCVGRIMSPLVVVMVGIILWEVLLRYVFNSPTMWAHETSAMLFGAYWILGGGYALRQRAHVNMDIIYRRLTLRKRGILDLVSSSLFFIFCGSLLWCGWQMFLTSFLLHEHTSSVLRPPWYPLKLTIPIAAFLILLQGLAKFIRDLTIVITGREAA